MNSRNKASLLALLVVLATLPIIAWAATNTDLPSLTHNIEVPAEDIQLSDADWDQILTSA